MEDPPRILPLTRKVPKDSKPRVPSTFPHLALSHLPHTNIGQEANLGLDPSVTALASPNYLV